MCVCCVCCVISARGMLFNLAQSHFLYLFIRKEISGFARKIVHFSGCHALHFFVVSFSFPSFPLLDMSFVLCSRWKKINAKFAQYVSSPRIPILLYRIYATGTARKHSHIRKYFQQTVKIFHFLWLMLFIRNSVATQNFHTQFPFFKLLVCARASFFCRCLFLVDVVFDDATKQLFICSFDSHFSSVSIFEFFFLAQANGR